MISPIKISDAALVQIQNTLDGYKEETGLDAYISLSIVHRGCSGLAYQMEFSTEIHEKDRFLKEYSIILRAASLMWLIGTLIDYEDTGISSGFIFKNPNQKRSCHCGEAFYI